MRTKTKGMILTALFAALTAILAQILIPIGPVPFNLAVLGAFLAGSMLTKTQAAGSMLVYMLLGAAGVPVFVGFQGGISILLGKTGGYVLGYIAIAYLTALSVDKKWPAKIALMLCGLVICYVFGTIWFMAITKLSLAESLVFCVYPFIIPDILKGVCAAALGSAVRKRLKAFN